MPVDSTKLHPIGSRVRFHYFDKTEHVAREALGTVCGAVKYDRMWYHVVLSDSGSEHDVGSDCRLLKEAA